ncbi:MAG TPA: protein-methionine-sulfoxide reductase heme-binding subunit MsrQ, partial [Myxococcales bacterium]|nr:protein-methionine-sulfoxide reductase heme-binding subunit MsrQ [Myxococcales bacterium]
MAAPHPWLKPGLIAGACIPGAVIVARAATGNLGANPIAEALNRFGLCALIFLVSSLACSPVKALTGWTWPIRIRRNVGVIAFCYASVHLLTYVGVDQGFAWGTLFKDVLKRPFIAIGFLAWLTMLPLAVTSTDGMVKRLGFVRWKQLHRVAYAAGALGAIHFYMRVKSDVREPLTYAAVLATLLVLRVVDAVRNPKPKPKPRAAPRPEPG